MAFQTPVFPGYHCGPFFLSRPRQKNLVAIFPPKLVIISLARQWKYHVTGLGTGRYSQSHDSIRP